MVAAEQASADSFLSIAGAGRPFDEVLMEQLTAQLPADLIRVSPPENHRPILNRDLKIAPLCKKQF